MNPPTDGIARSILNIIYKTLFPLKCTNCNKEGSFLCIGCENKLLSLLDKQKYLDNTTSIDKIISCFSYKPPLSDLIILGKYSFMPEVFTYLACMGVRNLKSMNLALENFMLCPIPLSKQRLRWRGFNQSQKLCEEFSKHLKIPWHNLLIRNRNTKTQKDLSRKERLKNVQNCFLINPKYQELIIQRSVLLVDDVITTGSTLEAAAKVLIEAKAVNIWGLALAKD